MAEQAHLPDTFEPQTSRARQEGWPGRKASAPSATAPHSDEWAWRSSVDQQREQKLQRSTHKFYTETTTDGEVSLFLSLLRQSTKKNSLPTIRKAIPEGSYSWGLDLQAGGRHRWSWSGGTWRGSWRPSARGCSREASAPETGSLTSWMVLGRGKWTNLNALDQHKWTMLSKNKCTWF